MSQSEPTYLRQFLRDLATPHSVRYYVIVGSENIDLLRVAGRSVHRVFDVEAGGSAASAFERFASELLRSVSYHGQPCKILLKNDKAFVLFKRIDGIQPRELMEDIKSIQTDDMELSYVNETVGGSRFLVAQGIDREYLSAITQSSENAGLLVSSVSCLGTFLFRQIEKPEPDSDEILLADLGLSSCGLVFSGRNILFVSCQYSPHDVSRHDELTDQYFEAGAHPKIVTYGTQSSSAAPTSDTRIRGVSSLFGNRSQRSNALNQPTPSSRAAKHLTVALNSGRLLVLILAAVALLSVLGGLALTLSTADDDELIARYQQKYADKLGLEGRLDDLRQRNAALAAQDGSSASPAAVVSVFCQERYRNLHLNHITLRPTDEGGMQVEVEGSAAREKTIFAYNRSLNEMLSPRRIDINSIVPEVIRSRQATDTILTFKLSVSDNEDDR